MRVEPATDPEVIIDPPVPKGVYVTKEQAKGKNKGGRPPKPFISELPRPPKFEIGKTDSESGGDIFFRYLRSIPEDKLSRITLAFYRYLPIVDASEGGTKPKQIDLIAGESHPFHDEQWEQEMLHRYGSGVYGCYLNEMNRTICRCLRIETKWDLENYPPLVDPRWLDQDHPQNKAYIQYLRQKGIQLPTLQTKEQEESEMQVGEAMKTMADTVSQLAMRSSMPVPPAQPSMGEKLTYDAAKSAIDMVSEQSKAMANAKTQEGNPLELVNAVVSVAEKISGGRNGGDDTLKLFLQDAMNRAQAAEERSAKLMDRLFSAAPSKSGSDSLKEMLESMKLIKELAGSDRGNGDEDNPGKHEPIGEAVLRSLPVLAPLALQFIDRGITMINLFRAPTIAQPARAPGPANPYAIPQQNSQQNPQQVPSGTQGANGVHPVNEGQSPPVPSVPPVPLELDEQEKQRQQYIQFHGFLGTIAPAIVSHLNDAEKNGYDFADWFISGYQRLTYDQIKAVGTETLLGAMRSYQPLWAQIGGIEEKVKGFINEFMTYDDLPVDDDEGEEKE